MVIKATESALTVRFLGWAPRSSPDKYNETIPRHSDRIVPFKTKVLTLSVCVVVGA